MTDFFFRKGIEISDKKIRFPSSIFEVTVPSVTADKERTMPIRKRKKGTSSDKDDFFHSIYPGREKPSSSAFLIISFWPLRSPSSLFLTSLPKYPSFS